MRWEVIRSNPGKTALLVILFCLCIYMAGYYVVAKSAAVDAAREYAEQRQLISGDSRVGLTGFGISVTGQEGEASFRLVDSSTDRTVSFSLEKRAGRWKVTAANPGE